MTVARYGTAFMLGLKKRENSFAFCSLIRNFVAQNSI
jgi:hypothetical protein